MKKEQQHQSSFFTVFVANMLADHRLLLLLLLLPSCAQETYESKYSRLIRVHITTDDHRNQVIHLSLLLYAAYKRSRLYHHLTIPNQRNIYKYKRRKPNICKRLREWESRRVLREHNANQTTFIEPACSAFNVWLHVLGNMGGSSFYCFLMSCHQ